MYSMYFHFIFSPLIQVQKHIKMYCFQWTKNKKGKGALKLADILW